MDAALSYTNGFFDLAIDAGSLATDEGLQTAVIVSLFSDRLAAAGDILPDNSGDRRGWWADAYSDVAGDQIGSHLWLLSRAKQLPATARRAEVYAAAALQWLIDDGIASAVRVAAEWLSMGVLAMEVQIDRPAGTTLTYRFDSLWEAINAA